MNESPDDVTTGADVLVRQLIREGVDTVFGVPGLQIYGLIDALAKVRDRVSFVTPRHEQSAAYMADGYARATGGVGVFAVVPGPGVLNAFAGLATASAAGSPVLAIVGRVPAEAQGRNTGVLHEVVAQSEMLDGVTGHRFTARDASELPLLVHLAFRRLRTAPARPVAIEVAPDLLLTALSGAPPAPTEPAVGTVHHPTHAQVRATAGLLSRADDPVLYLGGGARSAAAGDAARAFAEQFDLPVLMSQNGLGAVPGSHRLAADPLAARTLLADADAVLAVGTRFVSQGRALTLAESASLVLVNPDVEQLREPRRADLAVVADAVPFFAALTREIGGASPRRSRSGAERVEEARAVAERASATIAPQRAWLDAIRDGLGTQDAVLVPDFTQVGYIAPIAWSFDDWASNIAPGFQGNLGYAYAASLGVAAGRVDRRVIAIVGDGGFGWTLPELATARQHRLSSTVIVFDDGAYGNVARDQQALFEGREYGSVLVNPDFVALAEAFGIPAWRAATELELAVSVAAAGEIDGPSLIHVPVPRFPDPWHLLL